MVGWIVAYCWLAGSLVDGWVAGSLVGWLAAGWWMTGWLEAEFPHLTTMLLSVRLHSIRMLAAEGFFASVMFPNY